MKNKSIIITIIMAAVAMLFLAACSNEMTISTETPSVPASKSLITFQVLGDRPDVIFTHEAHAGYWNDNCLECHSHSDLRAPSVWTCDGSGCHSEEDTSDLCSNDAFGHDCMSVQCLACHLAENEGPQANDCDDCHMSFLTGNFYDSAVDGLLYNTKTLSDMTAGGGAFEFRPGEVIEFSVNGLVLGSSPVKSTMTPLDLSPTATDVTDSRVTNIARFLQTLDDNCDVSDGINIPMVVHEAVVGRSIAFSVDTTTFENNSDLNLLIADLNSGVYGTVFTAGCTPSLISSTLARSNLQATLDSLFPVPSGVTVEGIPNTHFVLTGSHSTGGVLTYSYQWYSSNTSGGSGEAPISGATNQTYNPVSADNGKYLSVEVTVNETGDTLISSRVGPSSINTVIVYGSITEFSEVDAFHMRLGSTTDVTINVEAFESENITSSYTHHYNCTSCHDFTGPADLNLPSGSSNGEDNDKLTPNIYLFDSVDSVVAEKDCDPLSYGYGCQPGIDAPGVGVTRNDGNPYLDLTGASDLDAGDYYLKIGAGQLSAADALAGTNTSGTYWANVHPLYGSGKTVFNNYKITFTFN